MEDKVKVDTADTDSEDDEFEWELRSMELEYDSLEIEDGYLGEADEGNEGEFEDETTINVDKIPEDVLNNPVALLEWINNHTD